MWREAADGGGEEGGFSQSHGSVGEPQVVTGQGLMPTRFYLTLPTLQGVERRLWSTASLLISFCIMAVISSLDLSLLKRQTKVYTETLPGPQSTKLHVRGLP